MVDEHIINELNNNGYRFAGFLNESKGLIKVFDKESDNRIFVAKKVRSISDDIYEKLKMVRAPGIPDVFDIIKMDGFSVVVEEFVNGENIGDMIDEERNYLKHVSSIDSIIYEILNVLEVLASIDPPIIHRDIKPDNIMIDKNKKVFLVDFNIARELDGEKIRDTVAMGTRGFAAPEQYGFSESDIRTDFYGLGATIRYIIDNVDIDRSYLPENERLKLIEDFTSKCMMMDKKDRFQTVTEIRRFLGYKHNDSQSKNGGETAKNRINKYRENNKTAKNKTNKYRKNNETVENINQIEDINRRYSYAPPGFRSKNPGNMIIALFVYSLVAAACILGGFAEYDGYDGISRSGVLFLDILTSVMSFAVACIVIFFLFNYRGMRDSFPFVRDAGTVGSMRIRTIFAAVIIFFILFFLEALMIVTLSKVMK